MTRERIALGRAGEEAAIGHLRGKGIRVVQRNFRCRLGELDIIARDGQYLVFVEVRTITAGVPGTAQESVGIKKRHKIRQVASYYLQSRNAGDVPVRFDVVAVTMGPDGSVRDIDHIANAF